MDYSIIEGRGSEQELKDLLATAHGCHIKVIADVVFNHMADMPEYVHLNFPNLSHEEFHSYCTINYEDGNRDTEMKCWLGSLPDLNQNNDKVKQIHLAHLQKLLDVKIDGFRFDAAKHMPNDTVQAYVDYINTHDERQDVELP